MTRDEFNANFAVRMDNTEGYTQGQLDALNALAFEAVEDCDLDDKSTQSIARYALQNTDIVQTSG